MWLYNDAFFSRYQECFCFLYIALHLLVIEVTIQISLISPKGVSTERWVEQGSLFFPKMEFFIKGKVEGRRPLVEIDQLPNLSHLSFL